MNFTAEELRVCRDLVGEEQAKSIGSLPSSFGSISGQNEIVRVFEIPTSNDTSLLMRFLESLTSSKAIAGDFTAPAECLTVTDPMCDGQIKEGVYRNSSVKLYRQKNAKNGTEYFYMVQTLRRGFVTSVRTHYEFSATGTGTSPAVTALKFYDSGETLNEEKIHHDSSGVYAKWFDGTNWIISTIGDVGGLTGATRAVIESAGTETANGEYVKGFFPSLASVLAKGEVGDEYFLANVHDEDVWYWSIGSAVLGQLYKSPETDESVSDPSSVEWSAVEGELPLPVVTYDAQIGHFLCATEEGSYVGAGGFTGTVVVAEMDGPQYDFSEFIIADGNLWYSGASNTVLKLRNVNPDYVEQIREELRGSSAYTDLSTRYDTVTGTHYYISAKPVPEDDDSYSILLFLSKHNNSNLYFTYKETPYCIKGFYYKWEGTAETVGELMSKTVFVNSTGQLSDVPTNIQFSGTNIGDIISLGFTFQEWDQYGRPWYRAADGTQIVTAWYETAKKWIVADMRSGFSIWYSNTSPSTFVPLTGWVKENGTGTIGSCNYSLHVTDIATLKDSVIGRTVAVPRFSRGDEDRLFDAEIEITWKIANSTVIRGDPSVKQGNLVVFSGHNINPDSSTATCKKEDGTLLSWNSFLDRITTVLRGTIRTKVNEDGTLDYEAAVDIELSAPTLISIGETGTSRRIMYQRAAMTLEEVKTFLNTATVHPDGTIDE